MTIDIEDNGLDEGEAIFANFGEDFQKKVVQAMIVDHNWSEQVYEMMKASYFDLQYLQYIVDKHLSYYKKYGAYPSQRMLKTIIKESLKDEDDKKLTKKVVNFFKEIRNNPELSDLPFVQEQSHKFCKNQAFAEAIEQCVDLVKQGKYDEIETLFKKAVTVGQEIPNGHDFFRDKEQRWSEGHRSTIPTGIPELDDKNVLDGGLGRGELGVFMAPKGVGKSHWLVQVGAYALYKGYNVVHYTFEMDETKVGRRYDAWLTGINSKEICERKDEVAEIYTKELLVEKCGRLKIAQYGLGQVNSTTLRAHLQRLKLKDNFIPDLIVVDYADNMRATENFDTNQTRHELKRINQNLRNLAKEFNCPLWTAFQSNKDGSNGSDLIITIQHCAEGYSRSDDPDIILGFGMDLKKKSFGFGKLHIAKSRDNADGLLFNMFIDRRVSRFRVVSDEELPEAFGDQEKEIKNNIKRAREKAKSKELNKLDSLDGEKVVH